MDNQHPTVPTPPSIPSVIAHIARGVGQYGMGVKLSAFWASQRSRNASSGATIFQKFLIITVYGVPYTHRPNSIPIMDKFFGLPFTTSPFSYPSNLAKGYGECCTLSSLRLCFLPSLFRPHRITMYVDAAYCYSRSSVVCLSVCHDREPCKTVEPIEMTFGMCTRMGPRKQVLDGGTHWSHLVNTIEPSTCGDDGAFLSNYFYRLFQFCILI